MAHGTPDWWGPTPQKQQHKLNDQAELAVRVGSPNWYDRRGTTILQESFEHGLGGWYENGLGSDWFVRVTTEGSYTGGYACELTPDNLDAYTASIIQYLRRPEFGGCGLEVTFAANGGNLGYLTVRANVYDGSDRHRYQGRYDQQLGEVQVRDSGAVWQTVGTPGSFPPSPLSWVTMKLRFDILAETYIDFLIGPRQYDASPYGPEVDPSGVPDGMYVHVVAEVSGNNRIHPIVDNVIVTQNEF